MITRFAPSPTGPLHRGHAFSALTAFTAAREAGGRFLLRIEDIDADRCRPEHEAAIYEDLAWLGLEWEEPVRRQSEHLREYEAALASLRERDLLYRCFRTRKEIAAAALAAPHGPEAPFRGEALPPGEEAALLALGRPHCWRLSLDRAREVLGGFDGLTFEVEGVGAAPAEPERIGDIVVTRKDVGVAYHLASVLDDAMQGVTHVIRGEDLADAPHIQRLLQALLGLPPPRYRHHRLILDDQGERLAKRRGGETLGDLRAAGMTGAELRARLGFGW